MIAANRRFTSVPFAEIHRVPISLCIATVLMVTRCAPLNQAVTAWPRPSCNRSCRMQASAEMAITVRRSSFAEIPVSVIVRLGRCGEGIEAERGVTLFEEARAFETLEALGQIE